MKHKKKPRKEKDIKKEENKEKEKEKKIEKKECTIEYPYELIRSGECIKKCNSTDFFNYICRINNILKFYFNLKLKKLN